jgi:hypothetical protein
MKSPTKADVKSEQPKATEAIMAIADVVLAFQEKEKPTLAELARITNRASSLLRIKGDEKMALENAAAIQLAKRFNLVT